MRAIAVKEIRELRRDRRTLAMLFLLPVLFLVVFGYAASFDVQDVPTVVVGPQAAARRRVPAVHPQGGQQRHGAATAPRAEDQLRRGEATVAVVTPSSPGGRTEVLIDGTELFAAQAAAAQPLGAQGRRGFVAGGRGGSPSRRSTSSSTPTCAPRSS